MTTRRRSRLTEAGAVQQEHDDRALAAYRARLRDAILAPDGLVVVERYDPQTKQTTRLRVSPGEAGIQHDHGSMPVTMLVSRCEGHECPR